MARRDAAPTEVNGLTCKVITGTTAAAEAGVTTIAHGLTVAEIVSWSSQIILSATSSVTQGHVSTSGFEFQVSMDATNAVVRLDNTNSENLLSKTIEILIWFEAAKLTAPAGDPDFASVVLLLDFAGNDGDTDLTDLSNSAHVDTFVDNAQIDTALQFIGENTLLLDGTTDVVTFPDSVDWDFGTDDFTIEMGFSTTSNNLNQVLIGRFDTGGWMLQHSSTHNLRFFINTSQILSSSWMPAVDTFFHVAITRSGTDLRAFIDGVQIGGTVTNGLNIGGSASALELGRLTGGTQTISGSVGAVRITKGVARYTANFTPPTEFYPTS